MRLIWTRFASAAVGRRRAGLASVATLVGALLLATGTTLAIPNSAIAFTIEFAPDDQIVAVGQFVSVDVVIRDPMGIEFGAYDILFGYDPTILGFVDVEFGVGLGAPTNSIQDLVPGSAQVEVVEVSLLPAASLPQDGTSDFVLFTVRFVAATIGIADLSLSPGSDPLSDFLSDELGFALTPDSIGVGRIEVVAVPEPSTIVFLLGGLGGLTLLRDRRSTSDRERDCK